MTCLLGVATLLSQSPSLLLLAGLPACSHAAEQCDSEAACSAARLGAAPELHSALSATACALLRFLPLLRPAAAGMDAVLETGGVHSQRVLWSESMDA